jgi:hypothetical protein
MFFSWMYVMKVSWDFNLSADDVGFMQVLLVLLVSTSSKMFSR